MKSITKSTICSFCNKLSAAILSGCLYTFHCGVFLQFFCLQFVPLTHFLYLRFWVSFGNVKCLFKAHWVEIFLVLFFRHNNSLFESEMDIIKYHWKCKTIIIIESTCNMSVCDLYLYCMEKTEFFFSLTYSIWLV